jgi:hypothetical protein
MSAAPSHQRRWTVVFIGLLVIIVILIALWIAHPNGSNTASTSAVCTNVGGALADGPDPSVPTGYAEAQVLPLREVSTSNQGLHRAILKLSNAYQTLFKDGNSKLAHREVVAATAKVNVFCPGVSS